MQDKMRIKCLFKQTIITLGKNLYSLYDDFTTFEMKLNSNIIQIFCFVTKEFLSCDCVLSDNNQNDFLLFPPCIGEFVPENHPVRTVNAAQRNE